MTTVPMSDMELFDRLSKDVKEAAKTMTRQEARFIVDLYYTWQRQRMRTANQMRAAFGEEPCRTIEFINEQTFKLEKFAAAALTSYARNQPVCQWAMSNKGIGPILSAGLLAHIDITRAPHVGHIYTFAGLSPSQVWRKGEKRPWNQKLKTLCWLIGESFVKVSGYEDAFYGQLYKQYKRTYETKNETGEYKGQAVAILQSKNWSDDTQSKKALIEGRLPQAQIHARAKRAAVKMFLSHWHHVAFELEYGRPPASPYVIAFLGHSDYLPPPHWKGGLIVDIKTETD